MTDFHVLRSAAAGSAPPAVNRIAAADVLDALRLGFADFLAMPSHVVFICILYPILGVVLIRWTSGEDALQLIYPLISGFALIGPFAALGLYEISKRREQGASPSWRDAAGVLRSPAIPGILALGLFLIVFLAAWLYAADGIYRAVIDENRPATVGALLREAFSTGRGWTLVVVGNLVGFVFAAAVLTLTVVAFPMMLDRDPGAAAAVRTSVAASLANPGPIAFWGLIVAAGLVAGSIPLFAGLAVVLPILGHATWHLYRKLVGAARPTPGGGAGGRA